jgi:hypothetical protein
MDRLSFLDSISGIEYPNMIVEFFDHFIALKKIVENYGSISVNNKTDNAISFNILFKDNKYKVKALSNVNTGSIVIYGRPISIIMDDISETEVRFTLQ